MLSDYYSASRPEMASFLPSAVRCSLEIGCGGGGFTHTHLSNVAERWGVEPNREAAAVAAPFFTSALHGLYDDVADRLPDGHFDLIVINDVMEHMPDHDRFLQEIKRKLAPDAVIVGSVPNIRHFTALAKLLVARDWPYKDDGILDRTHLRFFTQKSLARAFVDNGFAVERLHGIRSIIREGVTGLSPAKNLAARLAAALVVAGTLGYWADTQFPQLAFRVRRAD